MRWKPPPKRAIFAGLVFVLVFACHMLHHFSLFQDKFTFIWDGQGYRETCAFATKYLISLSSGNIGEAAAVAGDPDFVKHILHDGPVQTFILATVFAALGHVPLSTDWPLFVIVTVLCQSASSLLLFLLALEVTGEIGWAVLAALTFGIYPALIVSSGRFGTEPFMVLCLLSFVYFVTRESPLSKFAGGVFAGLAILLKAVLVPGLAVATGVVAFSSTNDSESGWKPRAFAITFAIIFTGVALAIAPWFFFTRQATGTGLFFTPRMIAYNSAVRLDIDSDGWCTIPESEFVASTLKRSVETGQNGFELPNLSERAPELAAITMRKIGRLISHPWNDFRLPSFKFFNAEMQDVLHKWVLFFSFLAMALCLTRAQWNPFKRLPSAERPHAYLKSYNGSVILNCSMAVIAGHFLYVIFQAIGRYFFTALPLMILFAVLGLRSVFAFIWDLKCQSASRVKRVGIAALFASAVLGLTWFLCATEYIGLPWGGYEKSTTILPGESLDVSFDFSHLKEAPHEDAILALVDADEYCEQADIYVNSKCLDSKIRPISRFSSEWYVQNKQLLVHSRLLAVPMSALRQWRAVRVPLSAVNLDKPNRFTLLNKSSHSLTVYGACKNHAYLPSPGLYGSDFMLDSMSSMDMRIPQRVIADGAKGATGDSPIGITFVFDNRPPRPVHSLELMKTVGGKKPVPRFSAEIDLSSFPQSAMSLSQTLWVSPKTVPLPGALIGSVQIPQPPAMSHLKVTLRGMVRLESGDGRIGVNVFLQKKNGETFVLTNCPDYVLGSHDEWKEFVIEDCIPMTFLGGGIRTVSVAFTPVPISQVEYGAGASASDALVKNLKVTVLPYDSLDFTGSSN